MRATGRQSNPRITQDNAIIRITQRSCDISRCKALVIQELAHAPWIHAAGWKRPAAAPGGRSRETGAASAAPFLPWRGWPGAWPKGIRGGFPSRRPIDLTAPPRVSRCFGVFGENPEHVAPLPQQAPGQRPHARRGDRCAARARDTGAAWAPGVKNPRAAPGGHEAINIPMAFLGLDRSCWRWHLGPNVPGVGWLVLLGHLRRCRWSVDQSGAQERTVLLPG